MLDADTKQKRRASSATNTLFIVITLVISLLLTTTRRMPKNRKTPTFTGAGLNLCTLPGAAKLLRSKND